MFLKRLIVGVLALTLGACASTYRGPLPDYSYVGTAADVEIQKFTLKEGFFSQGAGVFAMGADHHYYLLNSLEPVIQNVSPASWKKVEKANFWHRFSQIAILGAISILIAEMTDDDDYNSTDQALAYWSLLGVSFGAGVTRTIYMDRAAREYNQDLRAKFTPTLGLNFRF